MPELRKDYVLDRYVIIATERAKRTDQFKVDHKEVIVPRDKCFFCPGNEHTTPPEIMRFPDLAAGNPWRIRVFPNKFSAVGDGDKTELKTDNQFYTYADAVGRHEVIVETEDHMKTVWDLSAADMVLLFSAYNARIRALEAMPGIRYVQVFKNHGKDGGTSIQHSHSQLIAYNQVPPLVLQEEEACKDGCPYCSILKREASSPRLVAQNDSAICIAPYASRFPFEAWVFPKRHVARLDELDDAGLRDLSSLLLLVLKKLKNLEAHYNYVIHYGIRNLHLHIEILPRLATWAGFELATGTIINSMPPEKAAEYYREA